MSLTTKARASTIAVASLLGLGACFSGGSDSRIEPGTGSGGGSPAFFVFNLVSDDPTRASIVDPDLVNAWGIVPFENLLWIADNHSGKISIYDGNGAAAKSPVASGAIDLGEGITGIALNKTDGLILPGCTQPAQLIVGSETGMIFGINPNASTTSGFLLVDRSGADAIYKGVAVLDTKGGPFLLATDFHNGHLDVFDGSFALTSALTFDDPNVPKGFAPFNVAVFGDTVYVTYAMQDADAEDDVAGPGLGMIAAFDAWGNLLWDLQDMALNAPWGMERGRATFGGTDGTLLLGNFGDGHISVIDLIKHGVATQLADDKGAPIAIDGLWGIVFGDGVTNAVTDGLYFAAGPDDENHGLFGVISTAL